MSRRLAQGQERNKGKRLTAVPRRDSRTGSHTPEEREEQDRPQSAGEHLLAELHETRQLLAAQAAELRRTTLQLATAEQRERDRLARILHDDLQQLLLATQWNLQTLKSRLVSDPLLSSEVDQAIELLVQSIEMSRSLSRELSPPVLEAGLLPAVGWLVQYFHEAYLFDVFVEAEGTFLAVSDEIRDFAFQSIRELLFNAAKHSNVHGARLRLRNRDTCLEVTVCDEGIGFNPAELEQGFGLSHISIRAKRMGGQLSVDSEQGRGSTFRLTIPYSPEKNAATLVGSEDVGVP